MGAKEYQNGAIVGSNNWAYFSRNGAIDPADHKTSSWVQFEFTETTFTVLRYVHDTASPTADFTLAEAVAAVPEPSTSVLLSLGMLGFLMRRKR